MPSTPLVKLENLTHSYHEGSRSHQVLQGVNLEIQPGERVALLGRSGCGKSTLLNLLAGIDQPDSGRVLIAGKELNALNETDRTLFRRYHIGFIYQSFNLIPTLTVEENIRLPMELAGMSDSQIRDDLTDLLDLVGLSSLTESFPDQISGGEQQRVAILRALAHRPNLVLADEPTGNLDRETGTRVLAMMEELFASRGTTLLLVTHSLAVTHLADRVFTLDKGRVEEMDEGFAW